MVKCIQDVRGEPFIEDQVGKQEVKVRCRAAWLNIQFIWWIFTLENDIATKVVCGHFRYVYRPELITARSSKASPPNKSVWGLDQFSSSCSATVDANFTSQWGWRWTGSQVENVGLR